MAGKSGITLFLMLLVVGTAMAAGGRKEPTFILNGYDLSGIHGINTAELQSRFKDKPGARITQADIHADTVILTKQLEAQHVKGRLFTTLATKKGHVWIIFDLLHPESAQQLGLLDSQKFEGAIHVPVVALATATALKKGDQLSQQELIAGRRAIMALYEKSMPGKKILLKARLQHRPGGTIILTWIIGEPK
jgi:hypothetical protein